MVNGSKGGANRDLMKIVDCVYIIFFTAITIAVCIDTARNYRKIDAYRLFRISILVFFMCYFMYQKIVV